MKQLGYYGKTPHRGDFVRFNLPQTFVNIWDDWLQTAIAQAESSLESDWSSVYDTAPVYRFVLSAGIAGATPWAGCMSAQRDKVGRRFPFCFAMSMPENATPASAIVSLQRWFDQIEALCLRTHSQDYDFDQLQPELESMSREIDALEFTSQPINDALPETDPDNLLIKLDRADALADASNSLSLLSCILNNTIGEYSIWMTSGPPAATVLSAGLPRESSATALFSGHWEGTSAMALTAFAASSAYNEINEAATETTLASPDVITADDTQPIPTDNQIEPAEPQTATGHVHSPDMPHTDDVAGNRQVLPKETTVTAPVEGIVDEVPSADDWAALADFETDGSTEDVIKPTVEPLELDDDVTEDAPWET